MTALPGHLTKLGWTWMRVGDGTQEHLVPARLGPLSSTGCHRRIEASTRLSDGMGLNRCQRCLNANGGQP